MDHQPVLHHTRSSWGIRVRRPLERTVVLALWITCIVVLSVLALVTYVVRRSKPGRFKLTVKLLKLLDITIEVDAQDKPKELP